MQKKLTRFPLRYSVRSHFDPLFEDDRFSPSPSSLRLQDLIKVVETVAKVTADRSWQLPIVKKPASGAKGRLFSEFAYRDKSGIADVIDRILVPRVIGHPRSVEADRAKMWWEKQSWGRDFLAVCEKGVGIIRDEFPLYQPSHLREYNRRLRQMELNLNLAHPNEPALFHRLHPRLEMLEEWGAEFLWRFSQQALSVEKVRWLKLLADAIRSEARSVSGRKRYDQHVEYVRSALSEARSFVNNLFVVNGRLRVIHIVLGYATSFPGEPERVSYAQTKEHRDLLARRIEKIQCASICKLTHSMSASYRYNLLLFVEEAEARNDVQLAEWVGGVWDEITKGVGRTYNANAQERPSLGVGLIERTDVTKFDAMNEEVLEYMFLPDFYVRFVPPDKGRTTWRTNRLPKTLEAKAASK